MSGQAPSLIIIEDEPLITVMMQDMVEDLGWRVDGVAQTVETALTLLQSIEPKVAVLDISLGMETSFPVADACRERGIAVVFSTGYFASDFPAEWQGAPVLSKPFSERELAAALEAALNERIGDDNAAASSLSSV